MKKIIVIGLIIIFNFATITSSASNTDWTTLQHDNKRMGYTSGKGEIQTPMINKIFSADADLSFPIVYNGIVFIGSEKGYVYAVENFNKKWSTISIDKINCLAVDGNVLYAGSNNGDVKAYLINNGYKKWSTITVGSIDSIAVDDSTIYASSNHGLVNAYSADNGDRKWSVTSLSSVNSLALSDINSDGETEVITGTNYGVYVFDKDNGDEIGKFTEVNYVTSVLVDDEIIYAGSTNGKAYAIDGRSMTKKWSWALSGDSADCLALADDILYVGSQRGSVYSFSTKTGSKRWREETGNVKSLAISDINSDNNNDIIVSTSNKISVLNKNNGDVQWEINLGNLNPNIAIADVDDDQMVEIITTSDSTLYFIDNGDGNNPPTQPTGTYDGGNNQLIISSTDPDGDQIRYGVDWDKDDNIDKWTGYYPSGEKAKINCGEHKGSVYITAEDEHGLQSKPLSIKSKNKIKNCPVLEKVLELLPNIFTLFKDIYNIII